MAKSLKDQLDKKLAENTAIHALARREEGPDIFSPLSQVVTRGTEGTPLMVPVDLVDPNPWQPRTFFPDEEIDDLASSIAEVGLIQPIAIRKAGARYELIAGERRLRAHKALGLAVVPAFLVEASNDEVAVMALAENIDRQDLTDYEIGKAIRKAEAEFPSRKKMAEAIGVARQDFYRYLAFDSLPDFAKTDLDENPRLLSRAAAEDIKQAMARLKDEKGIEPLFSELWDRLRSGSLEQTKFSDALDQSIRLKSLPKTERSIRKLFLGRSQAGSITKDWRALTIKIKANALSEEDEAKITAFVESMFSITPG